MKLDTAPALSAAPSLGAASGLFAAPPPRGGNRLRVLDVLVAAVVVAAGGAVAANALLMQAPPQHAALTAPGVAGAAAGGDKGKAVHSTSIPLSAPLPQANPGPRGAGGETNGALGYLASKTSVTGMTTQLKPVSADEAAAGAIAAPRPVSSLRPPLKVGPLAATGPMTVPGSADAIRPPADVPASARVAAVQRALSKLGYGPLKATGALSLETRETIRRFERDRRLPVDGEVSEALVRELSLISGLAIN
ncbi:peptidoglycan-binding domain-containing protein [Xanthobacter sediminis]|uniref:peptidoglycan-binding domain-containing protein n=1 Tax=Xanthobacter sediminis TaxID=3119926 RepID=UPI0037264F42